ncbi:MAG: protein kinase, partial [Planctomycetota bacterium]|nr:protein kinase [Planctomycetota bacterium]
MPSYDDISLGAILLEAGFLKRQDLDRAVKVLEVLESRGEAQQLHAVIAAEGMVEVRVLQRALAQLRREALRCDDCGKEHSASDLPLSSTFVCSACKSALPLPDLITPTEIDAVTMTIDQIQVEQDQESLIGKTLGGVEIQKKLGQGGMGAVYQGLQISLNRPVALKILPPDLVRSRQYVARFTREAQAVAALNHPNVVQVFETGHEENTHYIVMELVVGKSLGDMLSARGTIPLKESLQYVTQAAKGLEAAGKRSIVHRDIKPDNILITEDGVAKVADFGLAKNTDAAGGGMTKTGQIMGTPAYMAPEQCEGLPADGRTDIYALGATLYHCLSGMPPFTGATPIAVLHKHIHEPLRPISELKPEIPPEVSTLIGKMLAKAPGDRYATAGALVEDLNRMASGATQMLETRLQGAAALPTPRAPRSPLGMAILIMAVVGVGGFFAFRHFTDSPPPAPGPSSGTDDGGGEISGTDPSGGEPSGGDPSGGDPSGGEPSGGELSGGETSVVEPVVTPVDPNALRAGTLLIRSPRDGLVVDKYNVLVEGEAASDIEQVEVQGSSVAVSGGKFSKKVGISEGNNEITITYVVGTGDRKTEMISVVMDPHPPELDILTPSNNFATPSKSIEVSGNVSDPNLKEVTINDAVVRVDGNSFRGRVTLDEGANRIEVIARDKAGNIELLRLNVLRDSKDPTIRFLQPQDRSWTLLQNQEVVIEVKEANPDEVTASGAKLRSLGDGRWKGSVSLREGENTVAAVVVDRAGNRAEMTRIIFLDSIPPEIQVSAPAERESRTREGKITVEAKVEDANLTEVRVGSKLVRDVTKPFSVPVS